MTLRDSYDQSMYKYVAFEVMGRTLVEVLSSETLINPKLKFFKKEFCFRGEFESQWLYSSKNSYIDECYQLQDDLLIKSALKFVKTSGIDGQKHHLEYLHQSKQYDVFLEESNTLIQEILQGFSLVPEGKVEFLSKLELSRSQVMLAMGDSESFLKTLQQISKSYPYSQAALVAESDLEWIEKHGIHKFLELHL
ncbi:hypothetical protein MJH12_18970 [bacterium]|nr:hypothetical protein [bacterium]